jgi:large subunit ribosomal protein L3
MSLELLGRKLGMTQIFTDAGDRVPVTVVRTGPCTVVQKKSAESDGYTAVQLGFEDRKDKHLTRAQKGHFEKAGVAARRVLFEVRVTAEQLEGLEVGQELGIGDSFEEGQRVDVIGTSKGRGFTGVVKRWNFSTHSQTHGTHEYFRHGGALGAGTYPGRIFKGKKMAGHYGSERTTVPNLTIARIDAERGLLFIRGSVPGHKNGLVRVRVAHHS